MRSSTYTAERNVNTIGLKKRTKSQIPDFADPCPSFLGESFLGPIQAVKRKDLKQK